MSVHNAVLKAEDSTSSSLTLEWQNSEEDSFTGSSDTLEDVSMTSAVFSTDTSDDSSGSSVETHSLEGYFSLTHTDQEDTGSGSGIPELFKVTEKPQAQILKHDIKIPPDAKITSLPFSSFPPRLQQLMAARAENISEVRPATKTPTVTYVWPVIKVHEASSPFWDNFPKYLTPASPDTVIGGVKCSHITAVEQLGQEKPDRKTARSFPFVVNSQNREVSGILNSLLNVKNKDCDSTLPLSSISPIGEHMEIPLCKENAILIYNEQVYFLYVMRHKALSPETELDSHDTLLGKTKVWLVTCRAIRNLTTEDPHPPLSRRMTPISQPKQCSPSTGKTQQFLNKAAVPSKEGWQKRSEKEARQEEDNELRKKSGVVKDVRVHLIRMSHPELTEDSVLKWKETLPLEPVLPKRSKVTGARSRRRKKKVCSN